MKWRTADWIWLTIVLLFAHGFLWLNNELMQVISYVSTFVSIALAGVAIYISIREATNGDKVKNEINLALGEMRSKLNTLDSKFDKFDPNTFNQYKDNTINDKLDTFLGDVKAILTEQGGELNTSKMTEIISSKVEEMGNSLKQSINIEESKDLNHHFYLLKIFISNYIRELSVGDTFTLAELYYEIENNNLPINDHLIAHIIVSHINEGRIEKIASIKYKRISGHFRNVGI